MATKDVKEFNGWFNRSYARLKERLSIYGKIDEDAFHDAYLAVRKQVMFASGGIDELESYFFGCYRRILQSGARDESRYDSPGDEYFARLGETDCAEETRGTGRDAYRMRQAGKGHTEVPQAAFLL